MGKRLIEAGNLESAICPATGTVYVDGTVILTPGAKDELTRRGIPVVYGPKPEAAACAAAAALAAPSLEMLVESVAGILRDHYGVNDPEQLRTLSHQMVAIIKENV